jgi:hypothetical protein
MIDSSSGSIPTLNMSQDELLQQIPRLGSAGLDEYARDGQQAPRGKILRLRLGMNPNSSSVGSNVIVFMWTVSACAAVFTIASGLLAARFCNSKEESADQKDV